MSELPPDIETANEICEHYPAGDGESLYSALLDLQTALRYVPVAGVNAICAHLGVPLSKAFSLATFHQAFSLAPKGKVIIRVCTGTACHVRGAQGLVDELAKELEVAVGGTTEDLEFTLETSSCVGACAMAPVVSVGGRYQGPVKPKKLLEAIR
jgi:NADH:ubiquinone oxidoreductase subunit E